MCQFLATARIGEMGTSFIAARATQKKTMPINGRRMQRPKHFSAQAAGAACVTAALWLCAAPALAGDLGLRPSQTASAQPADKQADPSADTIDWSALNWDPAALSVRGANAWPAPATSRPDLSWDRKEKSDGTSAVTVKKTLPTAWDSKIGVDMNVSNQSANAIAPINPERLLPGASADMSSGAAWASVTAPALNAPVGWDKATIDARFDPLNEERKIGTTVSKSVPLNERFSVTLQNGYSMTQAPGTLQASAAPIPAQPPVYGPSHYFSSENTAKLNVLPTGTSLSIGTAMSTTDDKWRRSLGAEQKLFGGISVKGSVSETETGTPDKSISAGFKRNW